MNITQFKKETTSVASFDVIYSVPVDKMQKHRRTDDKRFCCIDDPRSFWDKDKNYHVFPIFVDKNHVYVVYPCGEIIKHGSCGGTGYKGHRNTNCEQCSLPYTFCDLRNKFSGIIIENPFIE